MGGPCLIRGRRETDAATAVGISAGSHHRDAHRVPAPFSPQKDWVDVWSYGLGVVSSFPYGTFRWRADGPVLPFDGWAAWSGSSMAAPRVAAAIAHHAHRTGMSPREIGDEIQERARNSLGAPGTPFIS